MQIAYEEEPYLFANQVSEDLKRHSEWIRRNYDRYENFINEHFLKEKPKFYDRIEAIRAVKCKMERAKKDAKFSPVLDVTEAQKRALNRRSELQKQLPDKLKLPPLNESLDIQTMHERRSLEWAERHATVSDRTFMEVLSESIKVAAQGKDRCSIKAHANLRGYYDLI